ncbi:F-box/LRR-repeat protein 7-like [Parambassis ranga]|uniref:F-box/LRR-repeat protein 7-like n=1 Tax=Parambassis ranga TaxID=210632 RepID=A0A6P7IZD1_9TELE|nr:F-box/LRR-repeat protein 7-like [Parambassis ranga]
MTKTTTPSLTAHLTLPSDLTVYEQYQLCVHHLQTSQPVKSGCFKQSPEKQRKTSEDTCPITNNETDRHLNTGGQKFTAAEAAEERRSVRSNAPNLDLSEEAINTPTDNLKSDDVAPAEESAANPDSLQEKVRCCLASRGHQRAAKGQKKTADTQSPSSAGILPRGSINYTKKVDSQPHRKKTHTSLRPTKGYTLCVNNPRPTSAEGTAVQVKVDINKGFKFNPAGVPVSDRWLCLPDEVWLSILSLVSHRDLCRVLQVCHRLHTLATDHTLWKNLRMENSTLTDRWLLCVGRRRPRSLCLYSCSSWSVTSCGLEMFLFLCRNSLEELKVTSCTGPGLHGDRMLSLIGQLCNCVTSVDVSWSGATDTGVKSLSVCGTRLKLKSVVLNGCHITEVPLKELVIKHKESLCRLEVFGCQFLTPSCLQNIYEMCPHLQHLNIGRVPKVNIRCLTLMTTQLKCLISLNLTGLQVLDDSSVETLLQNCVKLQNLTFSSCPGVTDLILHNISKYTPRIRSLDVSGCKAVTDAGVQSLALGCQQLQQLDLTSTGTGNRGVSLLANHCSEYLQTVKLSFCHITAETILKLCRDCKRLKVLHIYGCAHLPTEAEIREVNSTVKVHPLT